MRTLGWKPIVVLAVCVLYLFVLQTPARAQVWPNGYSYRRTVTIDHTKVPNTDQTNFPVLFSSTYSDLATTTNGGAVTNSNGYDIIFTSDPNGTSILAFEQESYNSNTGAVIYWVQVPTVSHTSDTMVYLFYGNASVTSDQSNRNGVWDSNYKGIWHFANGSTLSGSDSSTDGFALTNTNGVAATNGEIDGAASFNGSNNYLSNSSLSIPVGSSITVSFWNYVTSSNVQNSAAFTIGNSSDPNRISAHAPWSDSILYWDYGTWNGGGRLSTNYGSYLGSWTYVVLEYNASSTAHSIYLNGNLAVSNANSDTPQATETGIYIGTWPYYSIYDHASLDEFRVSTIARSADWIAAEYNNQGSPATFYSTGTATSYSGPSISNLSPAFGEIGSSVTITGINFSSSQGSSTVTFNGVSATPTSWSSTQIVAVVPSGATSGNVVVTVASQPSYGAYFTISNGLWPNGYSNRSAITIDHTKVPNTDQANFPFLFSGRYSYLATMNKGGGVTNSNGYDIIFTSDVYGLNVLPFEQESYNPSTGAANYWIQIPTLSHTSDTVIYLFYGNAAVTTDQSNKNSTWDSNFKAVWHLPNGASLSGTDSTSGAVNGTNSGMSATAGLIDGAALGDGGAGHQINTANNPYASSVFSSNGLTLSAWVEPSSNSGTSQIVSLEGAYVVDVTGGKAGFEINGSGTDLVSAASVPTGSWTHIVGTSDSSGNLKLYINGVLDSTSSQSFYNLDSLTRPYSLGGHPTLSGYNFNGVMDELEVSNVVRSADWIATEYKNQSSPSGFYSVGSDSSYGGPDISSLSPNSGDIGISVTITGINFGSSQGSSTVTFGGVAATPTSWSSTQIVAVVPNVAVSGNVVVTVGSQPSNGVLFTVTGGGVWSNGYGYRRAITIDHTKVPNTDQKNFPMLLSGTYAYLATTSNGGAVTNSNGYDIIFTLDAAGTIGLPFEQDGYNPATGAANYWIQIPSLSHTSDTVIFLFFGNSSVTTDQSNKNGTWDNNYKGVWHLPNGSTLTANDSTTNANNGTISGSTATRGFIDGGASFTSTNTQYISIPDSSSLKPSTLTFSFWMQRTGVQNQSAHILQKGAGAGVPYGSYFVQLNDSGSDSSEGSANIGTTDGVYNNVTFPSGSFSGGIWYYIVGTFNSSTRVVTAYKNGQPVGTKTASVGSISYDTTGLQFGRQPTYGDYFNGVLDEVRVSSIDRSADWIATEYNNQSSPWAFYDEGGPAILSLSPSSGYFGTSVTITGRHFSATQGPSFVTFNGLLANVTTWSDTSLVVTVPAGATSGNVVVTVSRDSTNGMYFQVFPPSWSDLDVGTVGMAGIASYGNDKFTVSGNGSQLWNTADAFNFAYQSLSGDGTIIARLLSLQGTSGLQGAGIMIRETLTAGSTYAAVDYTNNGHGAWYPNLMYRTSTGGSTGAQGLNTVTSLPTWMKLVRSGSTFTAYTSTDCVDWTQFGSATINMATNVYVGLFVNSGDTSSLGTATFDNVSVGQNSSPAPIISSISATTGSVGSQVVIGGSGFGATQGSSVVLLNGSVVMINSWSATSITITIPSGATSGYMVVSVAPSMDSNPLFFEVTSQSLPSPWLDSDVGQVTLTGSSTYSGGTFTVKGEGVGLGNTVDGFHFVYQALSGDGSIVARIASFSAASNSALAGVMIRETLTQSSTHADEDRANDGGGYYLCYFVDRPTTGGTTGWQQGPNAFNPPIWVKVTRSGNTFTGYTSSDGVYWTQNGTSQTISMATNVYIGLITGSGTTGVVATATFDNVTMAAGPPATTPVITNVSPTSGGIGNQVTLTGQLFGGSQGTSNVYFNGAGATSISSWSNTQIVASVPSSASTGPITVVVNGIGSNRDFTFYFYNPVISSLQPPAAPAGGYITINGSGFGAYQGGSTVQFNAVTASVSSWSDTSIRVQVPSNATSGSVSVTVGGIVSGAAQFTIIEALSITSISPSSGEIGATVTISGTGFGPTQSNSVLSLYGATVTNITSWSDTSIVGVVPLGISTGSVSVGVAGATMYGPVFTLTSKVTVQDSQGNTSVYTSEVVGGQWRLTDSQGSGCSTCTPRGLIHNTYDAVGNVLSTTDPRGNTGTFTYDTANDLLSLKAPVDSTHSATTSYTYNGLGEVLTVTDALGNVTTNTYDTNGNLTSVTTPTPNGNTAPSVTQFAYNSLGEPTTITDPLNHVTTLTYTTAGLVATITDAQNHVTTYGYDAHGNRTSVKDANNQTTTFTFDAGDRLTKITYPDNSTISFAYDTRGRRTSVTDQNNETTTYAYDDANRITSVTDPANHTTTYAYDTEDNLGTLTDANTHSTFFTYDAFDRVTNANFPSSLSETYAYDADSNLISKTDRKGQTITYVYDDLNRLTSKTYPDTTSVAYIYDLVGKVLQVNDPTGTYAFAYDNMGRLIGTTTSYSFLTGRNFTTSYAYDAASNRTGFTDPEGGTSGYTYDTLNRLATLVPPSAFGNGSFGFGYDALSRRTQMTRPNNVTTNYTYDNLSHLLSVLHQVGSSTIDGASYGLDNAGNRISKTDRLANVTSNYTHDALYELTQVTQGSNTTENYSYDPVGNRASSLGVSPYSYNNSNELNSTPNASYTYDNNGNTVTKTDSTGTTTYAWDIENRLTTVTLPGTSGTVTFKYDPLGRRIYKSSSLGTSIFAYDGDNLLEETNTSGAAVARYAQGMGVDEPLSELRGSTTSYYEADGLGSVTSLSNTTGATAQTYTFDSFGKQTASSGSLTNPFRYTGREFDTETNLYYYRARYYDPTAGRFINEDPLLFGGGDANFYAYVGGAPVDYADPSGRDRVCHVPSVCGYDLSPAPPNYIRTDSLPPGSVQYTSPGGQTFWIPSGANWCDEYANAQANRGWNPFAIGAIAPGGAYDYQRDPTKHIFYSQFQQAANYSVGVYMQGWGFSRSLTIDIALQFGKNNSSNYNPAQIEDWKRWWGEGWDAAKSGAYAKSNCGCKK